LPTLLLYADAAPPVRSDSCGAVGSGALAYSYMIGRAAP